MMNQGVEKDNKTFVFENREDTFFKNLETFFDKRVFFDVNLVCNEEVIGAHSVVLACYSQYFNTILTATPSNNPTIIFSDISKTEMVFLLDYMYKGKVSVPNDFVPSFKTLLKRFKIHNVPQENGDTENSLEIQVEQTENITADLSPVLAETLESNQFQWTEENEEDSDMINKTKGKLRATLESPIQEGSHKVINPFARRFRNLRRNSLDFQKSPSPKKNTKRECNVVMSRPIQSDSDVEVIEKDPTVLVISDTQLNASSEMYSKARKRGLVRANSNEAELTSDDSEIVASNSKKSRWITIRNSSGEESEKVINPVALKGKGRNEMASTSKKVSPTRQSTEKTEPFEGYMSTPLSELKNYCVMCKVFKKDIIEHQKKYHSKVVRYKKYVCKECSKKFSFKHFLNVHICKK